MISNTTDDDFSIISLEDYREAIIELTDYGDFVSYDALYPDDTDFESRVEQDYYDGPQAWALDPERVSAYLKRQYDR